MRICWLALALLSLSATGCASWPLSSKWAMDNADYAAKYDRPYPKNDAKRYVRMAKQAVDARHVEGMSGSYFGMAAQDDPFSLGGEIGLVHYPTSYMEWHGSLAGLVGANVDADNFGDNAFLGINFGARTHSPSRIGPFVGVGGFVGMRWYDVIRVVLTDEDNNGIFEETEEEDCELATLAAAYPEVGVHIWSKHNVRLTASASYYLTSQGRDHDFWFFGFSIARFDDPHEPDSYGFSETNRPELFRLPKP